MCGINGAGWQLTNLLSALVVRSSCGYIQERSRLSTWPARGCRCFGNAESSLDRPRYPYSRHSCAFLRVFKVGQRAKVCRWLGMTELCKMIKDGKRPRTKLHKIDKVTDSFSQSLAELEKGTSRGNRSNKRNFTHLESSILE